MQLFPIHIYNTIEHKFLLHTTVNLSGCEGVMPIREENRNSKEYQKIIDDFVSQEGDKMKEYFKMTHPEFNYTNGAELFNICDHFICDLYDGRLEKESIISETFNKSCQTYLSNLLLIEEFGDKSQTVLNISMSPVFEELFYYMDNSIVNDMKNKGKETLGTYTPKLVMISGHDVSMLGMMEYLKRVFNINNPILVPFASSLSFEVYRKGKSKTTKDYQVNYYINDENIGNFSYEQFFSPEYIRGKLKSEDEVANFCQFSDWKEEQHINVLLYIILGLSVLLVVLVITLIIIIVITKVKIKRRNDLTSDDTNDNLIPPENK